MEISFFPKDCGGGYCVWSEGWGWETDDGYSMCGLMKEHRNGCDYKRFLRFHPLTGVQLAYESYK